MESPFKLVILASLLLAPAPLAAQSVSAEVTLKVPLNLTQFGPDLAKVRVGCTITSDAITNRDANHAISKTAEVPVSGGQVVTTASVVFAFTNLDNPTGKEAKIVCAPPFGWSTSQQTWIQITGGNTNPSFKLVGPALDFIYSSFTW